MVYQGQPGQTAYTKALVSGPSGDALVVELCTSVNVQQDPEVFAALLEGRLHAVRQPGHEPLVLAACVVVHDEELRHMALVIPDALRHEEITRRVELLRQIASDGSPAPAYARDFDVVFGVAELEAARARRMAELAGASAAPVVPTGPSPEEVAELERLRAEFRDGRAELERERAALELERARVEARAQEVSSATSAAQSDSSRASADRAELDQLRMEVERDRAAVADERRQLDELRERLEVEKHQLGEVSARLDRERLRMEEIEAQIVSERFDLEEARKTLLEDRQALDRDRLALEAQKLNLEEKELRLEQQGHLDSEPKEKTQVVSEDQFIEIFGEEAVAEEVAAAEPTQITAIPELGGDLPPKFDGDAPTLALADGEVLGMAIVEARRLDALLAQPTLMLQYAEVHGYPLIAALVARVGEDQQLVDSIGWTIDEGSEEGRALLDALQDKCTIRFGFYDPRTRALLKTATLSRPLERNVAWSRERAQRFLKNPRKNTGTFEIASKLYRSPEYERLDSMRHNFADDSFARIASPAEAKLAAGIVGYWSREDQLSQLVGNRSFPLVTFETIQRRTLEGAMEWGVYLDASLRRFAMEHDLCDAQSTLVRRLMANFAEVVVGLKPHNDLDPLAEWENWDALLGLAEDLGVQPDAEVVELAQGSLKRAREYQESTGVFDAPLPPEDGEEEAPEVIEEDVPGAPPVLAPLPKLPRPPVAPPTPPAAPPKPPAPPSASADDDDDVEEIEEFEEIDGEEIIARVSEATGVTYFIPDPELGGRFDDLNSRERDDLLIALNDARARLEASQVAIERFGAEVVEEVLIASEEMTAGEVASLARFVEERASGLEDALTRALKSGGPSTTYITARALARARHAEAIEPLLVALADPQRSGNARALIGVITRFGDALHKPLIAALRTSDVPQTHLELLVALERRAEGTLEVFAADRNRQVRQAARDARRMLK